MSQAQAKAATKNNTTVSEDAAPADFISVSQDRKVYNADLCKDKPLRGYLLDSIQFGEGSDRPFKMFLVKLTAPTLVVDREKKVTTAQVGDEVLIVATYALRAIEKLALNPQFVFEIWCKPISKDPIPGGNDVWRYDLKVSPRSASRMEIAPQTLSLPEGAGFAALEQSHHTERAAVTFP